MNFVYMDITILVISIVLATIIFIFFLLKSRKICLYVDSDKAFFVIDIVKALEEVCPLSIINKWQLLSLNYGMHRCWTRSFDISALNANIHLYGSTTEVNCPSSHAFALIADVGSWAEWNPLHVSKLYVKGFQDQQLKEDCYMKADQVVGVQRGTEVQSFTAMFRFLNISEEEVAWILFWDVKKIEFSFFIIQPVENLSENSQCLITHILGSHHKNSSHISLVAQRLRNIKDFICLSSLNVIPLTFTSSPKTVSKKGCSRTIFRKTHQINISALLQDGEKNNNTLLELVPFSYYPHCTVKSLKGFHLRVRKINKQKTKTSLPKKVKKKECADVSPVNSKTKSTLKRAASDFCIKSKNITDVKSPSCNVEGNDQNFKILKEKSENTLQDVFSSQKKENEKGNLEDKISDNVNLSLPNKSKQSLSENFTSYLDDNKTLTKSNITEILDLKDKCMKNQISQTANEKNVHIINKENEKESSNGNDLSSSASDFEVIESSIDLSDCRIAYYVTQGNYGASELQAEVLLASVVLQNLSISDIYEAGGWMYHSNYKGILVFSKNTASRFMRISSFMCQTEIPLTPKDVWKFVKNPRFRFMCDETVKSVEIIDKISNFQKLLHIYHEAGGILRKEMIDFCLLHTERKELNRYYSAFHSVESESCPFMNSVTRGILRPSGWIVEEVAEKSKTSKVTYMMQVLDSPDSLYFQELCSIVPQSLINLKHYAVSMPL